jgi:hypothetical protein
MARALEEPRPSLARRQIDCATVIRNVVHLLTRLQIDGSAVIIGARRHPTNFEDLVRALIQSAMNWLRYLAKCPIHQPIRGHHPIRICKSRFRSCFCGICAQA